MGRKTTGKFVTDGMRKRGLATKAPRGSFIDVRTVAAAMTTGERFIGRFIGRAGNRDRQTAKNLTISWYRNSWRWDALPSRALHCGKMSPHAPGFVVVGTARQLCSLHQLPYPNQGPPSCGFRRLSCRPLKTWLAPRTPAAAVAPVIPQTTEHDVNGDAKVDAQGLAQLLHALQTMREFGDFSVRMAGDRVGMLGKIADTFNEIVGTNQRMAQPTRARRSGGRPRRPHAPARRLGLSDGAWGEMERPSIR